MDRSDVQRVRSSRLFDDAKIVFAVTEWRVTNLQRTDDAASSNSRFFIVCISFKTSPPPKTECRIDYGALDDSYFISIGFSIRISNLDPSQYHIPCPPQGQTGVTISFCPHRDGGEHTVDGSDLFESVHYLCVRVWGGL